MITQEYLERRKAELIAQRTQYANQIAIIQAQRNELTAQENALTNEANAITGALRELDHQSQQLAKSESEPTLPPNEPVIFEPGTQIVRDEHGVNHIKGRD